MDNGTGLPQADESERPPLVRYQMMAILVHGSPLGAEEFALTLAQHGEFIASGGAGGRWTTAVTPGGTETGIVMAVYTPQQGASPSGTQAVLDHERLDGLTIAGVQLPSASLCGVRCREQNLDGANLQGSVMVDSDFSGSSFRRANLRGADLSRSDLVGCDFRDADLRQADFENADLSSADMTGAKVTGARFPGACMDGLRGLNEPAPKPPRPSGTGSATGEDRRGPDSWGSGGQVARRPAAGDHGKRPE